MNRLDAIQARRGEVLRDIARTREAARAAVGRARDWVAPMAMGVAAGRAISGGWMRAAALLSAALVLWRKLRAR